MGLDKDVWVQMMLVGFGSDDGGWVRLLVDSGGLGYGFRWMGQRWVGFGGLACEF